LFARFTFPKLFAQEFLIVIGPPFLIFSTFITCVGRAHR
jgi:hypothetical protein